MMRGYFEREMTTLLRARVEFSNWGRAGIRSLGFFARLLAIFIASAIICACAGSHEPVSQPLDAKERPSWSLTTSGVYRTLAVGDFNGDLKPDVIGGSTVPGAVAVWYFLKPDNWSMPAFLAVKGNVFSVSVEDLNLDGRTDVAFSISKETQGIRVWMNQEDGKWTQGTTPMDAGSFNGICTADIDKDGKPDLLAAAAGFEGLAGIKAWLGNGQGGWREEIGPVATGQYHDVAVGDFNEDNCPDVVGSGYSVDGALRIWLGNCRGGWSQALELEKGNFNRLTLTDINQDGHQDLLVGTYREGLRVYMGNGRGDFVPLDPPVKTGSFWRVVTKETRGTVEILASSLDSKGIMGWEWQKGQFKPVQTPYASRGNYYDLFVEDLEGNGRKVLIASSDGEGIRVWPSSEAEAKLQAMQPVESLSTAGAPQSHSPEMPKAEENETFKVINGQPHYCIGPGDLLEVTVWRGGEQKTYPITVGADGKISFSFVQDLPVQGLTFMEVADLLRKSLKQYVLEPLVEVRVKEFHSKTFTALGAINMNPNRLSGPGTYVLKGKTTVLTAISMAGGPTPNANLQQVSVRRKNGATFMLDLYKTISRGDLSQDIVIDNGDTILVPEQAMAENKIFVLGEVKTPGVFPLRGEPSLVEAISLAGGFLETAVLSDTKIVRGDLSKPQIISRDLKKLLKEGDMSQNMRLQAGDVVYVPRTALGNINAFLREVLPIIQAILLPFQLQTLAN